MKILDAVILISQIEISSKRKLTRYEKKLIETVKKTSKQGRRLTRPQVSILQELYRRTQQSGIELRRTV